MLLPVITLIVGFALGLAAAFVLKIIQAKNAQQLAEELYRANESQRQQQVTEIIESVKASFGNLSFEALSRATAEFLKLARETTETLQQTGAKDLDSKKALIDQQLQAMTLELQKVGEVMNTLEKDRVEKFGQLDGKLKVAGETTAELMQTKVELQMTKMSGELEKVSNLVKDLERDRVEKFGQLDRQLRVTGEQTQQLLQTTGQLKEALASTKVRGQWGERMAEDVLRIAGFVEGVNYRKQATISGPGTRPDFTFMLPRSLVVNMDVKFPFENYLKYLECETSGDKQGAEGFRRNFLRDVKSRIKEVAGREYINPSENTVDYVLLFIPNEQVYAFIHEQDSSILDEGLKQHVVFCSPVTLFAVLAVIRQATDNFSLEQTSREIMSLLGAFNKQWGLFVKAMEKMGDYLHRAQDEFANLTTTRQKQLERPLAKIEELRREKGILAAEPEEPPLPPPPPEWR